jgi:hypothetical protein
MGRERDDFSGRYTREFPLSDFIEAVEKLGLAATQDVADEVECSYDLAYRRLKELQHEGKVEGKKIGNTYHWQPVSE